MNDSPVISALDWADLRRLFLLTLFRCCKAFASDVELLRCCACKHERKENPVVEADVHFLLRTNAFNL
jgi:hypothetical protein